MKCESKVLDVVERLQGRVRECEQEHERLQLELQKGIEAARVDFETRLREREEVIRSLQRAAEVQTSCQLV